MEVFIKHEAGYECALYGMALSYHDRAAKDWWTRDAYARAQARAAILAHRDGGHNKFLESIAVWLDVEACRAWWSEFDTYRVGITKQSESTMHTLAKRPPTDSDFETGTPSSAIVAFIRAWQTPKNDIHALKVALPEGFLQRRLILTNYKTLRTILIQREGHRLVWWREFADAIYQQAEHPELLPKRD